LTAITATFTGTLLLSPIPMNHPTHWDQLEYYPCTFALPRFLLFSLFSSSSHSSVHIPFRLLHFARPASRKTELQKNSLSALSALQNTRVFWRFMRKFHHKLMAVNFPNADWLSDLRTQLKAFVGGVYLRSKRFFLTLFSQINFFTWSRHFKELQLKGDLFDCPQI